MTVQDVFEMVRDGRMTFDEFDDWVSEQRFESYREGSDEAEYQYNMSVTCGG